LGTACARTARYDQATDAGRRALSLARATGDNRAEVEALLLFGVIYWYQGQLSRARTVQHEILKVARDRWQIARTENNLAMLQLEAGDHSSSLGLFRSSLSGFREAGDHRRAANVLSNLSHFYTVVGDLASARGFLREFLDIDESAVGRYMQAIAKANLAGTLDPTTDLDAILNVYDEARSMFRQLGDLRNESVCLNSIGSAYRAAGRVNDSMVSHQAALVIARHVGAAREEAQALRCLGLAEIDLGHHGAASEHLTDALRIARSIHSQEEEDLASDGLARIAAGDEREG
jgi:tetratricopeptide (TPR) repeat protein